MTDDKPAKQKFKVYPIGYFQIDFAEVRTEEGKLHLYVGIDRTSKFAFAQLHDRADQPTAVAFLEALIEAVPCQLYTILTDNGIQFAPTCRRTAMDGQRVTGSIASTRSAVNTVEQPRNLTKSVTVE